MPFMSCLLGTYIHIYISAIFDQEAKIVFMDIRFACRHLCVCGGLCD